MVSESLKFFLCWSKFSQYSWACTGPLLHSVCLVLGHFPLIQHQSFFRCPRAFSPPQPRRSPLSIIYVVEFLWALLHLCHLSLCTRHQWSFLPCMVDSVGISSYSSTSSSRRRHPYLACTCHPSSPLPYTAVTSSRHDLDH